MKICKYDLFFILIVLGVLCIFTYFGWQDVDIQFLGTTFGDELPQFKQLNNILEGYLSLDLEKMFKIEFYNYGYIYYLLNVLVTAPFNLAEKYDWAIFAPRFLNGIFSILNLWMVYKISNLYLKKSKSLFLVAFCLLIPGFWFCGYIFKPDVFQAFFVLYSVYFLCLDNFAYRKNFYLSVLMLGLGVGVAKFQAIIFLPLLCSYVFAPFFKKANLDNLLKGCWQSFLIVLFVLFIWVVTNPYLLHPIGMRVWWNMFLVNMLSNATNHGSYIDVSFVDKLLMESRYFLSPIAICYILVRIVFDTIKDRKIYSIWLYISIGGSLSLLYLLVFVNKTWGLYYISTVFLFVLLIIPCFNQMRKRFIYFIFSFHLIDLFIFHPFDLFVKKNQNVAEAVLLSNEIVKELTMIVNNPNLTIYTDNPNFAYHRLGLTYKNVYQIFGGLSSYMLNKEEFSKKYPYKNPNKYFKQYDLIVISKEMVSRSVKMSVLDLNAKISKNTIEDIDKYGYKKIAESVHFLFYRYQGD